MLAVLAVFLVYLAAVPVSVAVVAEGGVRVGASIFLPGAAVRSARPISGKPKKKKRTDLPLAVRASIAFLKRLRPMEMRITGRIGLDDAAQTAQNFGRLNAAIYPLAGLINGHKRIKSLHIGITPDFTISNSVYNAEAVAYIRIYNVIAAVISIIKYLL